MTRRNGNSISPPRYSIMNDAHDRGSAEVESHRRQAVQCMQNRQFHRVIRHCDEGMVYAAKRPYMIEQWRALRHLKYQAELARLDDALEKAGARQSQELTPSQKREIDRLLAARHDRIREERREWRTQTLEDERLERPQEKKGLFRRCIDRLRGRDSEER